MTIFSVLLFKENHVSLPVIFSLFPEVGTNLIQCNLGNVRYCSFKIFFKKSKKVFFVFPAGALPSKAELLIDPEMDQELDKL